MSIIFKQETNSLSLAKPINKSNFVSANLCQVWWQPTTLLSCPPIYRTKGFPWGRKGSCLRSRLMSFDPTRPNSRLKANFFTIFCFLAVYSSGKTHSFLLSFSYLSFPLCPLPVLPSPLRALPWFLLCRLFIFFKNFFKPVAVYSSLPRFSRARARARAYNKYTVDTRFCGLFLFLSPLPSSAYSLFSSPSRAISPSQKNFFAKSNYRNAPFPKSVGGQTTNRAQICRKLHLCKNRDKTRLSRVPIAPRSRPFGVVATAFSPAKNVRFKIRFCAVYIRFIPVCKIAQNTKQPVIMGQNAKFLFNERKIFRI